MLYSCTYMATVGITRLKPILNGKYRSGFSDEWSVHLRANDRPSTAVYQLLSAHSIIIHYNKKPDCYRQCHLGSSVLTGRGLQGDHPDVFKFKREMSSWFAWNQATWIFTKSKNRWMIQWWIYWFT